MTKKYTRLSFLFGFLSFLAFFGPIAFFCVQALINSDLVTEKITITMSLLIIIILSLVAVVNKVAMRSRIWIFVIALYIVLDTLIVPFLVIACCQIADELIFTPLHKRYKTLKIINREIDKRS